MTIDDILRLADGPWKTGALAEWIQGRFDAPEDVPVLVGGAAVELYTAGAYTTGDLDFVGVVGARAARALAEAGFERQGRHWVHEKAQVFVEFPGRALGPEERSVWIRADGHRVRIVDLADLLVDRLGAWEYWQSSVDGVNAWLLFRQAGDRLDAERLEQRVRQAGWRRAFASLYAFATRWRDAQPPAEELEAWANDGP